MSDSASKTTDEYARELFLQRHGPNAIFPDDVRKMKTAEYKRTITTGGLVSRVERAARVLSSLSLASVSGWLKF